MPQVSVVVPIYNVEQYLKRCLDSLVHQTLNDIEFILVDDCSTDSSPLIADEYSKRSDKFKVIHKTRNEGLGKARNTGIEQASGEYIAFLDGDDYVEKETYKICYENARKEDVDTLIFGYFNDTPKGMIAHPKEKYSGLYKGSDIAKKLFPLIIGTLPDDKEDYAVGVAPCWQLIRLHLLREHNIRFVSERKWIYEDLMFALELYRYVGSTLIIGKPLYHYVTNPSSLTMSIRSDRFDKVKSLYIYLKRTEPYSNMIFANPDILIRFKRIMISYIRLCIMQLSYNHKNYYKIKEILDDEVCNEIVFDYPVLNLPFKQRVFAICIKYKFSCLIYIIVKTYNLLKNRRKSINIIYGKLKKCIWKGKCYELSR